MGSTCDGGDALLVSLADSCRPSEEEEEEVKGQDEKVEQLVDRTGGGYDGDDGVLQLACGRSCCV